DASTAGPIGRPEAGSMTLSTSSLGIGHSEYGFRQNARPDGGILLQHAFGGVVADAVLARNENHSGGADVMEVTGIMAGTGCDIHRRNPKSRGSGSDGFSDRDGKLE